MLLCCRTFPTTSLSLHNTFPQTVENHIQIGAGCITTTGSKKIIISFYLIWKHQFSERMVVQAINITIFKKPDHQLCCQAHIL